MNSVILGESATKGPIKVACDDDGRLLASGASGVASETYRRVTTAATGTAYTALAAVPAAQVVLWNNTGVTLEARQAADPGNTFDVPDGTAVPLSGITSASDIELRRKDTSNTQVTLSYQIQS